MLNIVKLGPLRSNFGFSFRPKRSKNRWGKYFINFAPAVNNEAGKEMRQETRRWGLHLQSDKSLEDLSKKFRVEREGSTS